MTEGTRQLGAALLGRPARSARGPWERRARVARRAVTGLAWIGAALGATIPAAARAAARAEGEPRARIEHFVLEHRDGSLRPDGTAQVLRVGRALWRRVDEGEDTVLELEVSLPEEDARLLLVERLSGDERFLVWRELRPSGGRSVVAQTLEAEALRWRCTSWGARRNALRSETARAARDGGFLEIAERARAAAQSALPERAREGAGDVQPGERGREGAGDVQPGEHASESARGAQPGGAPEGALRAQPSERARLFDPLADDWREVVWSLGADGRRAELRAQDGLVCGWFEFDARGLAAFGWQASGLSARRVEPSEWERAVPVAQAAGTPSSPAPTGSGGRGS